MARSKTTTVLKAEKDLATEIRKLTTQVKRLQETEPLQAYRKSGKFLFLSFMKGIMLGLGSVIGASLVVGLLIFILGQISFVPIIGDFVNQIVDQLELSQADTP